MERALGPVVAAMLVATSAAADDVLSRSQSLSREMAGAVHQLLHQVALQRTGPWSWWISVPDAVQVAPSEGVYLMDAGGKVLVSSRGPDSLSVQVRDRIRAQPAGVDTYHAFNAERSDVVRRDVGWTRHTLGGREWIVVVERDRPLERTPDEPLTGRWMGAYSYSGIRAGGAPAEKEAGPMSALVLQKGDRCQFSAVSQRWNVLCSGIVAGTNLAVAADSSAIQPTVILEAVYSPDDDRLRGTMYTAGHREAGRATIFLQRAPE